MPTALQRPPGRIVGRRRGLVVAVVLVVVAVIAGVAVWWYEPFRPGLDDCAPGTTPTGSATAAPMPWPRYCVGIGSVLERDGMPAVDPQVELLHVHQHLTVMVHGADVRVPAGVGIDAAGQAQSPLHTHTSDGLLHVESPRVQDYRLGQFFDVWGVRLDRSCIGSSCADPANALVVYVDGQRWTGDPAGLELRDKISITILFGTPAETGGDRVVPTDWSQWDV